MDDLIEEMLADEPIPEAEERLFPRPLWPQWPFANLDDRVPHLERLPVYQLWVEILNDAKDEFEVGWHRRGLLYMEGWTRRPAGCRRSRLTEGIYARASRLALDARMADVRATQLLGLSQGSRSFSWESSFSGRKLKMIGSLKTSLIQSGLSERRARGSSRSLGTQALGYWLKSTVCSINMPTPSPQLSTASTPSGIRILPTQLHSEMVISNVWLRELWSTLRALWEARDLHPHGDIRSRSGKRKSTKPGPRSMMWSSWRRSSKERSSWGTSLARTS